MGTTGSKKSKGMKTEQDDWFQKTVHVPRHAKWNCCPWFCQVVGVQGAQLQHQLQHQFQVWVWVLDCVLARLIRRSVKVVQCSAVLCVRESEWVMEGEREGEREEKRRQQRKDGKRGNEWRQNDKCRDVGKRGQKGRQKKKGEERRWNRSYNIIVIITVTSSSLTLLILDSLSSLWDRSCISLTLPLKIV